MSLSSRALLLRNGLPDEAETFDVPIIERKTLRQFSVRDWAARVRTDRTLRVLYKSGVGSPFALLAFFI